MQEGQPCGCPSLSVASNSMWLDAGLTYYSAQQAAPMLVVVCAVRTAQRDRVTVRPVPIGCRERPGCRPRLAPSPPPKPSSSSVFIGSLSPVPVGPPCPGAATTALAAASASADRGIALVAVELAVPDTMQATASAHQTAGLATETILGGMSIMQSLPG